MFRIVKGQTKIFSKIADSGNVLLRHFCADCGSWIFNPRGGDPTHVVLKVGTLDQHEGMKVVLNIWARSRRPRTLMDSTIKTYQTDRPDVAANS